ncbi:hypothetical protein H9P43_009617 [Blastocladiella emersonii ATCC 22665]|nr:hypothetical protein H9P43_009617 [Blastocladiella emersonii ATCC 22665]
MSLPSASLLRPAGAVLRRRCAAASPSIIAAMRVAAVPVLRTTTAAASFTSAPARSFSWTRVARSDAHGPSEAELDAAFIGNTPMDGAELRALIEAGRTGVGKEVLIVDVRNASETAEGMIPTAVHLPLPELANALNQPNMQFQLLNQFPKPSRESDNLVVYCKAGVRAENALKIARELGFKRVRNYKGSWNDWTANFADTKAPSS